MPAHIKRDDRRPPSARKPRQQAGGSIPEDGRNSAAGQPAASSSSLPDLTDLPSTVAPAVEQAEETAAASPACRMNAAAEDEYNETRSTSASESEKPPELEDSDDEPERERVELPHNFSTLAAKPLWADMESSSDEGDTPTAKELQAAKAKQHGRELWAYIQDSDDEKRLSAGAKQKARGIAERGPSRRSKVSAKAGHAASSSSAASDAGMVAPEIVTISKAQAQYDSKQWAKQGWWPQEMEEQVDWGSKAYTWKGSKSSQDWWGNSSQQSYRSRAWSGNSAAASSWSGKPQCQFFIGIEEEPKFKVTRKILGPHGQNMKDIVQSTGAKLRLRGRGSGFKEGVEQQESTDELMLCVSATDWESYQEAVHRVSELLQSVYEQYRALCKKAGNGADLEIRMHEGPRPGSR